jgi:transposase-like protein
MMLFYKRLFGTLLFLMVLTGCTPDETTKESSAVESENSTLVQNQTEITCPKCGFKKKEVMPTDVCQIKYTCTNCQSELVPKDGDCCVYCTYGTHKCPSKQD